MSRFQSVFLFLFAVLFGLVFLREPGFGDDFTYWNFAFDLKERGLDAWQVKSFHDLRWPVWGGCLLMEKLGFQGLPAYYFPPLFYLACGACVAGAFGRLAGGDNAFGWAVGIAFLFHPLLDTICYRPMPDLSEGVLGASAMLAWWAMCHADKRWLRALWASILGILMVCLWANRPTGMFLIFPLGICTLLLFPRCFGWLCLAGFVAALGFGLECLFYKNLFGNWLHALEAISGATGRKGTESIAFWKIPFRFLDSLSKGNPLAPFYCITAVIGMWTAWRQHDKLGRMLVIWFWSLYLAYACAPQDLSTWRLMLRDADRFLAGLAVPFSVLSVIGISQIYVWIAVRWPTAGCALAQRPVAIGAVGIVALFAITSRDFFDLGIVPELRGWLKSNPSGTRVFTHDDMQAYSHLIHGKVARNYEWNAPNDIIASTPENEAAARGSDQIWYLRKLLWLTTRKKMERGQLTAQPQLASYFAMPEEDWRMARVIARGDTPDAVFYRKRLPGDFAPVIITEQSPELVQILPSLPFMWKAGDPRQQSVSVDVPQSLKGKLVRMEIRGSADNVEPFQIRINVTSKSVARAEYLLKPYFFPESGLDFFAIPFPPDATKIEASVTFAKTTKWAKIENVRLVGDVPDRIVIDRWIK